MQRTVNKGGIILGQVEDNLIQIKHSNLIQIKYSKDMTAGDMKNAVMPLIQMFTDWLICLAHGNNLLSLTHRNYITFVLPHHMSVLGKKEPTRGF